MTRRVVLDLTDRQFHALADAVAARECELDAVDPDVDVAYDEADAVTARRTRVVLLRAWGKIRDGWHSVDRPGVVHVDISPVQGDAGFEAGYHAGLRDGRQGR